MPLVALGSLILVGAGAAAWLLLKPGQEDPASRLRSAQAELRQADLPASFQRSDQCETYNTCLVTALHRDQALRETSAWLDGLGFDAMVFCPPNQSAERPCFIGGTRDGVKVTVLPLPPWRADSKSTVARLVINVSLPTSRV